MRPMVALVMVLMERLGVVIKQVVTLHVKYLVLMVVLDVQTQLMGVVVVLVDMSICV